MRLGYLFFLALVAGAYCYGCRFFPGLPGYHGIYYTPGRYEAEVEAIRERKGNLKRELEGRDRADVIRRAGAVFREELDERLFPYWMGTRYDFYGSTQVPGKGRIACGYFVTTVLEDMGVPLRRIELARMASEEMVKDLVGEEHIRRYSGKHLDEVLSDVQKWGRGIYVVGLDTHTGFLLNDGEGGRFIHASGRRPWSVVEERASESIALRESEYRVVGCLTKDEAFLRRWMEM